MIINTNVSALIGLNNLRLVDKGLREQLEKLSSGLRVNKAADDPSGLAIATKMGAQIRGMSVATQNAEDTKNMIHILDGALAETTDILFRMRDLAVRAANEATLTTADMQKLNNEFQALKNEIDRKSLAVTYNTKKLMNGEMGMRNLRLAGRTLQSINLSVLTQSGAIGVANASLTPVYAQIGGDNGSAFRIEIAIAPVNGVMLGLRRAGSVVSFPIAPGGPRYRTTNSAVFLYSAIPLASMRVRAQRAISQVQNAINYVADVRAFNGQQERRIDHIIDDLAAQQMNISAAKSRIMDAEMGAEIAEFTRLQILQQSGTAVLAQANMSPAGILQLLR